MKAVQGNANRHRFRDNDVLDSTTKFDEAYDGNSTQMMIATDNRNMVLHPPSTVAIATCSCFM